MGLENIVDLAKRREERPLSYPAAIKRIRQLWASGQVIWTRHAEYRLFQRGLDMLDVEHVIKYGKVIEHSRPAELWRYKVVGTCVDKSSAACLVEIEAALIIVTVIV